MELWGEAVGYSKVVQSLQGTLTEFGQQRRKPCAGGNGLTQQTWLTYWLREGGGERVADMTTLCERNFTRLRYLYFWLWLQLAPFPLLQVGQPSLKVVEQQLQRSGTVAHSLKVRVGRNTYYPCT